MNTASACLLVCVSVLPAYDAQPAPGLDLRPAAFADLRLLLGVAAPVTAVDDGSGGGNVSVGEATGPQGAVQWVQGRVDTIGWGLGIELAAAEHRGRQQGPAPANGDVLARVVSLSALPKLVLRPEGLDPVDWPPGFFQLELGPVLGLGIGQASLPGTDYSSPTVLLTWGARMEAVFTVQTGMQLGLFVGYEDFLTSPKWQDAEGSLAVGGLVGGLSFGWRLR